MRPAATECHRPEDRPPSASRDALPEDLKTGIPRRATLLSWFYDIYVTGQAAACPPIRRHAGIRHFPRGYFEAGAIQSGASWLVLLTMGATS
jgi:hypothetical protein